MNIGRLIFGIVIGAAAGALAGVLFAPDKGTETRRKLLERGDNYTRNLKDRFNNFKSSLVNKGNGSEFTEGKLRQESATNPAL